MATLSRTIKTLILLSAMTWFACESDGPDDPQGPPGIPSTRDLLLGDGISRTLDNCSVTSWYFAVDPDALKDVVPLQDILLDLEGRMPGVPAGQATMIVSLVSCESSSTDIFPQSILHVGAFAQTPTFPETRAADIVQDVLEIVRYTGYEKELKQLSDVGYEVVEAELFQASTIENGEVVFNGDVIIDGNQTELRLVGRAMDETATLAGVWRYWHETDGDDVVYSDYAIAARSTYAGIQDSIEIEPASIPGVLLDIQNGEIVVTDTEHAESILTIEELVRMINE